jgi:hypothetical protein
LFGRAPHQRLLLWSQSRFGEAIICGFRQNGSDPSAFYLKMASPGKRLAELERSHAKQDRNNISQISAIIAQAITNDQPHPNFRRAVAIREE